MGKIVVSENVSLDGVTQDPTGEEGFKHGGWFLQVTGKDREEWAKIEYAEALGAEALLLGRRSYEYFAGRWATRTGEWADRLRSLPKYVVSSAALAGPDWQNTTVITGDVASEVSALKQALAGEIVVYGSRQLVRTLFEHDLADEVRLSVYPVVLGAGDRLFDETGGMKSVRPVGTRTIGDSLVRLTYAVIRDA